MPVIVIMACGADGPVGTEIPRGPWCFGGARVGEKWWSVSY